MRSHWLLLPVLAILSQIVQAGWGDLIAGALRSGESGAIDGAGDSASAGLRGADDYDTGTGEFSSGGLADSGNEESSSGGLTDSGNEESSSGGLTDQGASDNEVKPNPCLRLDENPCGEITENAIDLIQKLLPDSSSTSTTSDNPAATYRPRPNAQTGHFNVTGPYDTTAIPNLNATTQLQDFTEY
ncbi:hypothetical protein K431DRAFT_299355 [Polychaeton citri CBS 116435]|uniref:Uncharacterized protein n=1 Tax=Polychaeton citri CBS 116435 TaxID=1314669 RepID=A0A9P4QIA3_9PEZI|nr:hypothetical protein K431DRAFT_299355 [Polychaeton citri CBS 116435]